MRRRSSGSVTSVQSTSLALDLDDFREMEDEGEAADFLEASELCLEILAAVMMAFLVLRKSMSDSVEDLFRLWPGAERGVVTRLLGSVLERRSASPGIPGECCLACL